MALRVKGKRRAGVGQAAAAQGDDRTRARGPRRELILPRLRRRCEACTGSRTGASPGRTADLMLDPELPVTGASSKEGRLARQNASILQNRRKEKFEDVHFPTGRVTTGSIIRLPIDDVGVETNRREEDFC